MSAPAVDWPVLVDEVEFAVEAGKVAEFQRAVGAAPGDTVPPTFVVVAGHWRDQAAMVAALGLDIARVVVGSCEWEYHAPVRIGDRLHGARRLVAGEQKGHLRLFTLETTFTRVRDGAALVTQRDTLIEVGPR